MFVDTIRKAALENKTINITYKKKVKARNITSETKDYQNLEPYKIAGDRFWAFDTRSGHIKQFILREDSPDNGIVFLRVNEDKFEPRYPIEV